MTRQELLATLEEGLENGRISRHMAAYIAAEVLGVAAHETDYLDWVGTPTKNGVQMTTTAMTNSHSPVAREALLS